MQAAAAAPNLSTLAPKPPGGTGLNHTNVGSPENGTKTCEADMTSLTRDPAGLPADQQNVASSIVAQAVAFAAAPETNTVRVSSRLVRLSLAFGFGQGCCNSIYISAAGYYGEKFDDSNFFILMCAVIYLTPFLLFPIAKALDPYYDRVLGVRDAFHWRLVIPLIVAGAFVAGLGLVTVVMADNVSRAAVLLLGAGIGLSTGSVAMTSSQFFGVIAPQLVPWWFLGQTASGAYANIAARLTGFMPNCKPESVLLYYASGVVMSFVPPLMFIVSRRRGQLEESLREVDRHSLVLSPRSSLREVTESPANSRQSTGDSSINGISSVAASLLAFSNRAASEDASHGVGRGFEAAVVACQVLAIAFNISLTSLANVIAHGDFMLGQQIVLLKLLADFIGRSAFYGISKPVRMRLHLALNWLLLLCRLPIWIIIFLHALSPEPLLSNIVLLSLWVPFVAAGAMGSSWGSVIGIAAVRPERKRAMSALLQLAVYSGFFVGVIFAITMAYWFRIGYT